MTLTSLRRQVFRRIRRPWGRAAVMLLVLSVVSAGVPLEFIDAHDGGNQRHHHHDDHDHEHHPAAAQVAAAGDALEHSGDREGSDALHCHAAFILVMHLAGAGEQAHFTAMLPPRLSFLTGDPPASTSHRPPHRPPIA